jgi:F0F1-type ATP synthase assembly protein I
MKRRRYDLSLAGLGIELAASVIGLTLLGVWIDRRWQTDPWGVVICASIGFAGGMYNFVLSARRAAREAERKAAEAKAAREHESAGPGGAD